MSHTVCCCADPLDINGTGARNQAISASELPFNLIFTVEMLFKMFAFGLVGKGAYFTGDKWNWCVLQRPTSSTLRATQH